MVLILIELCLSWYLPCRIKGNPEINKTKTPMDRPSIGLYAFLN